MQYYMKTISTKPLILVDGSSYLYRAFHAMPMLTNSKGFPTGAVYGVINMLRRLFLDYDPDHIAVVFDAKGKTFRDDMFDQYKANRAPMPSELAQQIEPIHAIIRALGIPIICETGVEADDVIGTLVQELAQHNMSAIISTGDKDLAQLVNTRVTLINTMSNTLLNPQTVIEKFGIPAELIVDYLALIGDTIDNIPGVPQVGPKTAVKWLTTYGSLDKIIANASAITGKVGEKLRESLGHLPLSKALATIKLDVPLPVKIDQLQLQSADHEKLRVLYSELEFRNWLNELESQSATTLAEPKIDRHAGYELITNLEQLEIWLNKLTQAEIFAFDTETTSLNYMIAEIVGLSFAIEPGKACYIPLAHDYANAPAQLNRAEVLQRLKPIFENAAIKKIAHNIKYDSEVLANYAIQIQGIAYDTMLESYILDSASNKHGMDSLAAKYLNWQTIRYEDIAGKGAKQIPFNQVEITKAATYAAEDADVTLQLHQLLWPKLTATAQLAKVYTDIEMPLVPVLAQMERTGVLIDPAMLIKQTEELTARLAELAQSAYEIAGGEFNMNSPKQLQEILYGKLNLPVLQKTPTGQPSTADPVLQELAHDYPFAKNIIEHRGLSKLISTYTKRLPEQVNAQTQRIHTSYNQTGAATGRLSSSEPNLQNIPIRTKEGRRIRQAFIAPPGYKIVRADYSQIELRIMAHISSDENLLAAFAQNLDVHQATAAEVMGVPLDKVTTEDRRRAKAINFGLIYGMSGFGLAKQMGVDRQTAQAYIERYFTRYPGVKAYMENTRLEAHENGFVQTLWGRRLYLPEINSKQIQRQKGAERAAINAPLQGSAADIIKRAMISLAAGLNQLNKSAKMIMQVHDELVFEVLADEVAELSDLIRKHMMNAASLKVPLLVSIGSGNNWDEAASD
jgi:DNA polymerase-1